jgi:hypothetical protein
MSQPLAPDAPTLLECWRSCTDSQDVDRGTALPRVNPDAAPEPDERAPTSDAAARGPSGWLPDGFSSAHPPPDAEPRESGNLTSDGGSPSASYISPEDGPTDPALTSEGRVQGRHALAAAQDYDLSPAEDSAEPASRQGGAAAACRPHKPESAVRVRPMLPRKEGEP